MLAPHLTEETGPQADASRRAAALNVQPTGSALPQRSPGGEHGTEGSQEAAWGSLCTSLARHPSLVPPPLMGTESPGGAGEEGAECPGAWALWQGLGTDILGLDPGSATTACRAAPEA